MVLIHSPLVGPLTWTLVSRELLSRGMSTVVPTLDDVDGRATPYWKQHAEAVARQLKRTAADQPLVLVGHSGAGPLLPTIRALLPHRVAAYVFVDAGLPHGGLSRLEEMEANAPEFASELRRHLEAGRCFPEWTDQDLRDILPDDNLRRKLLAELRPRPLEFFEEPIPVFAVWPDAPCEYLKLSAAYDGLAEQARRSGWAYRAFDAGHFHMLVAPGAVTEALLDLVRSLCIDS